METAFITIHDLSPNASILFASPSITDILGYEPSEVVDKSAWEYFHPEQLPFAKAAHGSGITLDKAAVLKYCHIKDKLGRYISCECTFTVVFDCLVGCTSIYRQDRKSQKRAVDAPIIRQLFSSSPQDPRYYMLSQLSSKFDLPTETCQHEPRAALFINRFTASLPIEYATRGLSQVLKMEPADLDGRSFYSCIRENCRAEAIKCLESAKANDSIAYLRFWFRDPRADARVVLDNQLSDDESYGSDPEVAVKSPGQMDMDTERPNPGGVKLPDVTSSPRKRDGSEIGSRSDHKDGAAKRSSGRGISPPSYSKEHSVSTTSGHTGRNSDITMFDAPLPSSGSSISGVSSSAVGDAFRSPPQGYPDMELELEAVISCTSDGLVVILRAARPLPRDLLDTICAESQKAPQGYPNGIFAAPWANPSHEELRSSFNAIDLNKSPGNQASGTAPPAGPSQNYAASSSGANVYSYVPETLADCRTAPGSLVNVLMDNVVFAWALININKELAQYRTGEPQGASQPAVWQDQLPVRQARQ